MSTRPDPPDDHDPDTATDSTGGVSLERFDENRQAGLLTMKALNRLGLEVPINEPLLRERTPGGDDYVVVVPLGPAIGTGGAKVACMMWGVEEDTTAPITFTIDDREADTWVEGFPAEEINGWADPAVDAEYETYPVERVDEERFELVASTDFLDSYDGADAEAADESSDDASDGVVEAPDTTLDPDDDPTYY